MPAVTVLILAPDLAADAGPLERVLDAARAALAEHHRAGFVAAGAGRVVVRREPPDATPFGARLRRSSRSSGRGPGRARLRLDPAGDGRRSARPSSRAAAGERPGALANHRASADVVAIACAGEALRALPDLASDNALPRWLAEVAGFPVRDLRARRRLAMDLDSPLDVLLLDGVPGAPRLPGPDERRRRGGAHPAGRAAGPGARPRRRAARRRAHLRAPTSAGSRRTRGRARGP